MSLLIKGGRLIDPAAGIDGTVDVLVDGDRVVAIGHGLGSASEVYDASGLWVLPGLIDLNADLGEPGHEGRETMVSGSRAAAAGGYTAVVAAPLGDPLPEGAVGVAVIRRLAAERAVVRVHPTALLSKQAKGQELAELGGAVAAGAVALSDGDRPMENPDLLRRALLYARPLGVPVMLRPIDPVLAQDGLAHEGFTAMVLGLRGLHTVAETAALARQLLLAEATGGRLHVQQVSCARSVELLREAKRRGVRVTAEVSPLHLWLTDEAVRDYNVAAKLMPPLRSEADRLALLAGVADGTIDAIASGHRPLTPEEKDVDFESAGFGASQLETALGVGCSLLSHLTPARLVEAFSAMPARILGLSGFGTLAPGSFADVTLIDPQTEWRVDPHRFYSRGKSTPLAGHTLTGRVVTTIVAGRMVMRDGEVLV